MIGYKSSLPYNLPTSPIAGLASPVPQPGASQDVYAGLMRGYNAKQNLAQEKADYEYDQQYQDAQRNLLLGGLRNMTEASANQRGIANSRMNLVSSLLSGLYK
ncbi:MAG: hypothetical protein EBT03_07230 [Betaproteobacteria bacterium]|jgi:hypothetical protein|nr:hypothetical protein [Betaproteobacteria bacterium]NCA17588.1 hypothetical protein [Betaproteobacteria bacterium]